MINQLTGQLTGSILEMPVFAGGGSSLLFSDTFTDTNGTLLSAHTPDVDTVGTGWSVSNRAFTVESNAATAPAWGMVAAETSKSDVVVECTVIDYTQGGPIARCSDNANYWHGIISSGELLEVVANVFTARADCGAPSALPNTMSLECSGSSITIVAETGLSATYANATFNETATKHGIYVGAIGRAVDDFSVNTL